MCLEHTINVGLPAQLDAVLSLEDVNAIVLLVETSFSFNPHGSTFSLDVCWKAQKRNGFVRLVLCHFDYIFVVV